MPKGLDAGDRKLLMAAGFLLIALVIASTFLSPEESEGRSFVPSTYSTSWSGAKAAYTLLEESGYKVERWEEPPTALTGDATKQVLILADPYQKPSADERAAIVEFLRKGGRILATGGAAARLLPDAVEFREEFWDTDKKTFSAQIPSPLVRGAPEIQMTPPHDWHPKSASQLIVYGNKDTAAVVTYRVGKGDVIWWGAPTPLINSSIMNSGNLALFLNSIGPAKDRRILWDEYFHGAEGTIWSYFSNTPVPWGFVQFGLVFLAVLFTYSRRHGPIYTPAKTSRLSPLEFVETLGDLYTAGHAGSAAVRIAYQRFRFVLTRQLGLASNVPYSDLARSANQSLGWDRESLFDTLSRAERAMRSLDLKDDEARQLVQEIFDYTTRLEVRRSRIAERQT